MQATPTFEYAEKTITPDITKIIIDDLTNNVKTSHGFWNVYKIFQFDNRIFIIHYSSNSYLYRLVDSDFHTLATTMVEMEGNVNFNAILLPGSSRQILL